MQPRRRRRGLGHVAVVGHGADRRRRRAAARRDHLDGLPRRRADRKRSSAARCRSRATTRASCGTWIKLTGGAPAHSGKDPIAHILWFAGPSGPTSRAAHVEVPRAEGLAEPQAHRPRAWRPTTRSSCTGSPTTATRRASTTTPSCSRLVGHRPRAAARPGRRDRRRRRPAAPTSRPSSASPAGIPVIGGTPDVQSAAIGSGAVARLRGPPLRRHVVVAHVPRAVQEDRPAARRGVAAVAAARASTTSPTSRRPRARASTGCATACCSRRRARRPAGSRRRLPPHRRPGRDRAGRESTA